MLSHPKRVAEALKRRIGSRVSGPRAVVDTEHSTLQGPNHSDFDQFTRDTIFEVSHLTHTSPERIASLIAAVRHVVQNDIPGDVVECGVWKGGSMVTVAKALMSERSTDRHLYLFDTFDGMTEPSVKDVSFDGHPASQLLASQRKDDPSSVWCSASLSGVKQAMACSGYPLERVHYCVGMVEETIPKSAPDCIAILRLDTDWYESTKHELEFLYPRLSAGGILIVDDYGHWAGAREATDEYFRSHNPRPFLSRIDYTGRLAVKPW